MQNPKWSSIVFHLSKSRKEQLDVDGISVQIDGQKIMEDVNDSWKKKKSFVNYKLTVCCSEFRSHFSSVSSMLLRFWFCKTTDGYQLKQVFALHFLKLKWWSHSLNFAVVHRELVLLKGCLSREKLCVYVFGPLLL